MRPEAAGVLHVQSCRRLMVISDWITNRQYTRAHLDGLENEIQELRSHIKELELQLGEMTRAQVTISYQRARGRPMVHRIVCNRIEGSFGGKSCMLLGSQARRIAGKTSLAGVSLPIRGTHVYVFDERRYCPPPEGYYPPPKTHSLQRP